MQEVTEVRDPVAAITARVDAEAPKPTLVGPRADRVRMDAEALRRTGDGQRRGGDGCDGI